MTTEILIKMLITIKSVKPNAWGAWDKVMKIVSVIQDGSATVKNAQWHNSFKQNKPEWYPLQLDVLKTWSTYTECINLKFFVDEQKVLICEALVFDGEPLSGTPNNKRFSATIELPLSFIYNLEDSIKYSFDCYLNDAYDKHLEEQARIWIENKRNEIIGVKTYDEC